MIKEYLEHIINDQSDARHALKMLEYIPQNNSRTLFVVNKNNELRGTVTDGDIRRGLLHGREIVDSIVSFMNTDFKVVKQDENIIQKIAETKKLGILFFPIVDDQNKILKILDLKSINTVIPATAVIMAGGRGERLRPFTDTVPKPMLIVGDKPIIEHNIDRLIKYGISDIVISVRYLSEVIMNYLGDGSSKGVNITYILEDDPLGTIGALGLIKGINTDHILLMNSDVLTNIDFEDFFNHYLNNNSSMCIASISYQVEVPYAVLDIKDNQILSFIEKPSYTYYSSAGIYFLNKELQNFIPRNKFYNATDLMQNLISKGKKVIHYPMLNYWLDIGKHQDFMKAQEDVKHLNF
jgi:dTDP-glucose pyrophosphorylase